ncbi:MAG: hypothetical protein AABW82_01815 [Nanoarchaeota archaeon]
MKTKNILIYCLIIIAISFALYFNFDVKLSVSFACLGFLILSYSIYKEKIGQELIIAFLMALIITSYYVYLYNLGNILIGRINLFPLVAWTFGLVLLREIYERFRVKHKFLIIVSIYWFILLVLEYIGYYTFGIRLNWNYDSLFGLGIIHGPNFLKFFYLFAGPIYLLLTDYLKVK